MVGGMSENLGREMLIVAAGRFGGFAPIATVTAIHRKSLSAYARGTRRPDTEERAALEIQLGIPSIAWELAPDESALRRLLSLTKRRGILEDVQTDSNFDSRRPRRGARHLPRVAV